MTIQVSNRQYSMLQEFADNAESYMSIAEAQKFDQRPFGSMLHREWIAYHPGRGFRITRRGRDSWRDLHNTPILRLNAERPLTHYFDPIAYGLNDPYKKRKLHLVAAERGAA